MLAPDHMRTKHGYAVDEVASAVQKCIRRGWQGWKKPIKQHGCGSRSEQLCCDEAGHIR